ncbi:hypothetical protein ABZ128_09510 [Streptomyces sp. NPDC006326]|uniref:DUF7296 family protein n=1 Tax=Streptomyces sp. NPDC006326 TaxID=3156752 RepID=UPI0033AB1C5E
MFFHYSQNNSGGGFTFDARAGISVNVIVEAESAAVANARAEEIGLYFDGAGDCQCCGDRWGEQWSDSRGTATPQVYGEPVLGHVSHYRWMKTGRAETFVHYADGRVQGFDFGTK